MLAMVAAAATMLRPLDPMNCAQRASHFGGIRIQPQRGSKSRRVSLLKTTTCNAASRVVGGRGQVQ